MATLVLSTVGTALGGPVGAAIGALIGQSFDQQLLGSGSRGPRLGDLSVQTSSYGTQVPRIYGRMRVAGSVIWSTDLTESAATTGAKGQPDTVYSYSVSFAVALSSRPIAGVGRIWADGKLIRDVDGVFKVPTTFRYYEGGESQGLDPLIGSIEGIASTPAYRGLALAVFENLELAEFGNRLPFLTFEVLADEQPTIGTILTDASGELIECQEPRTVVGYAAHGRSIRTAVEPLVSAYAVPLFDEGEQLRTPMAGTVEVDADRELGASADEPAPRHQRSQLPAGQLPATLRLTYYDPARDYQFGEARASAGDEIRTEEQRDLPAVIEAGEAKALAQALVARSWAERDRLTVRLPMRHVAIEPGSRIELPFNPAYWLVDRCTIEGFACVLELRPSAAPLGSSLMLSADAGMMPAAGQEVGEMTMALFEAPPALSSEQAILLAASSSGPGWRSERVEVEVGTHKFAERTARRKSVLGRALSPLGPEDRTFDVELIDHDQWLTSCDEEALSEGANLAMLGREVIQFRDAVAVGRGRFRLGELVRGQGGTDATVMHGAGEFFVLLERDALRRITIPGWMPASRIAAKPGRGSEVAAVEVVLNQVKKAKKDI